MVTEVRARDPARTLNNTRVNEERDARTCFTTQNGLILGQARADVALHQFRVTAKVFIGGNLNLGFTDDTHELTDGRLDSFEVSLAVAGDTHDGEFALTVRCHNNQRNALECVRGSPRGVLRVVLVRCVNERFDGLAVRGQLNVGGRRVGVIDRVQRRRRHGLNVGGVTAWGDHEGVLACFGWVQKLFRLRATHRSRHREHRADLQAQTLKNLQVRRAVSRICLIEAFLIQGEGIGVLHNELTATQQARTRAGLVAVFRLDLVQVHRQILIRGVHVFDQEGEHFLVRWRE